MSTSPSACLPDVAEIIMGQSPPGDTYNEASVGLPFFQGKTEFGEVSPTPRKWCNAPKKIAEAGDILISVRAPVGPTNLASTQCCIGRGLAAIRANPEQLDPSYLRFALRHAEPRLASMGQGSTFAAIGRAELAKVEFPLPSLVEQRRIVDILSRAEGIVRLRREAEIKAAELIPALFLDMFGDPATNPKRWPALPIVELCAVQTGGTPSRDNASYYEGEIPWVKTGEVAGGVILKAEEHISAQALVETNCKKFPVGTILVAMYGQGQTRGRCAVLGVEASTNQACAAILPSDRITGEFLFRLLQTQYEHLRSLAQGGNQANLNLSMIKNYRVIVPPISIQNEFVERVNAVSSIQSQQSAATVTAQATFDALLSQVFSASPTNNLTSNT